MILIAWEFSVPINSEFIWQNPVMIPSAEVSILRSS